MHNIFLSVLGHARIRLYMHGATVATLENQHNCLL